MKSILTREKHKKTQKGITLIALVVTIIVLLILAGVSIAMLTGQNGILRRAEEAGTSTAHAEVYEMLNLQTVDYMTESKLGEYNGSLVEYLSDKGYIETMEGIEGYIIKVEALLGQKGKYGNGTDGITDVYKLEEVTSPSTGKIEKVATTGIIKIAETKTDLIIYNVIYYGKSGSDPIPLGKLADSRTVNIPDYSARLYEYYKDMDYNGVEGENIIDDFPATYLFSNYEALSDYVEYREGIYKVEYTDNNASSLKGVKKVPSNADFTKFGVYQVDGIDVLVTPEGEDGLVHGHETFQGYYYLKDGTGEVDWDRPFTSGYRDGSNYYDDSGALVPVEKRKNYE